MGIAFTVDAIPVERRADFVVARVIENPGSRSDALHLQCLVESYQMRLSTIISVAIIWVVAIGCGEPTSPTSDRGVEATPAESSQLPPQIERLRAAIQDKSRDEVFDVLMRQLGKTYRFTGSGYLIVEWDIDGGVLTYHHGAGVMFTSHDERTIHLIPTQSPLQEKLYGRYSMHTPLGTTRAGQWLGTLHLQPDQSYVYVESGQFPAAGAAQREDNNFFYEHPAGSFEIEYADGFDAETLLEDVPTDTVVALIHFRGDDATDAVTFTITTNESQLVFGASSPLSFSMWKGWRGVGWRVD